MPTRNNWPTRWATVIREKIRAGQEGGFAACADGEALLLAGSADGMLADVLAGPAAGRPPEVRPQPEQARASANAEPTKAPIT